MSATHHIASLVIDDSALSLTEHEHERRVAIHDLLEWNHFVVKDTQGPYAVTLGTKEGRITFTVTSDHIAEPLRLSLTLQPFRTLIRDYFLICESYKEAIKGGNLPKIEAIDMSRRGLHNEGSELLQSLLVHKVEMDFETARRLFTLIAVMHIK